MSFSLQKIDRIVEEEVIRDHKKVLDNFFEQICSKQFIFQNCSYQKYLRSYINEKLKLHVFNKRDRFDDKIRCKKNLLELRELLYSNVCGKCCFCKSRKKNWNSNTIFLNWDIL